MTPAQFRKWLAPHFPGAELRNEDGCAFYLTAPEGHTWDGDLHEFVAQCRAGIEWPRDRAWEKEALAGLKDRALGLVPVKCGPACDWCHPEGEE